MFAPPQYSRIHIERMSDFELIAKYSKISLLFLF